MSTTKTLNTRIQLRRDSESDWTDTNKGNDPIIADGEPVVAKVNGAYKLKIGDGRSEFSELDYIGDGGSWNDLEDKPFGIDQSLELQLTSDNSYEQVNVDNPQTIYVNLLDFSEKTAQEITTEMNSIITAITAAKSGNEPALISIVVNEDELEGIITDLDSGNNSNENTDQFQDADLVEFYILSEISNLDIPGFAFYIDPTDDPIFFILNQTDYIYGEEFGPGFWIKPSTEGVYLSYLRLYKNIIYTIDKKYLPAIERSDLPSGTAVPITTGNANKVLTVNAQGTGYSWQTPTGGSGGGSSLPDASSLGQGSIITVDDQHQWITKSFSLSSSDAGKVLSVANDGTWTVTLPTTYIAPPANPSNGQVLTYDNGSWVAATPTTYITPPANPSADQVLTYKNGAWTAADLPTELPSISSADVNKVLTVVLDDGTYKWAKADVPTELPTGVNNAFLQYTNSYGWRCIHIRETPLPGNNDDGKVLTAHIDSNNAISWTYEAIPTELPDPISYSGMFLKAYTTGWSGATIREMPSASDSSYSGKFLKSNGTNWVGETITALPSASDSNYSGKFLKSNGTSWIGETVATMPTGSSSGQVAYYNGSAWSAGTYANILPSSASSKDIIYYSGSAWTKGTCDNILPAGTTSGNVLTYNGSTWTSSAVRQLPAVTSSDNGKFLTVVNGAWAATTVLNAYGQSF